MSVLLYGVLAAMAAVTAQADVAATPPMGWRSWNCFKLEVTQQLILDQVYALAAHTSPGRPSLLDAGYGRIGIDDGWQACGEGENGSFHDKDGNPLINKTRFPDMKAMNALAHAKGVQMGWYHNNCWCNAAERKNGPHVAQDSAAVLALDFDGVKIDGCGPGHNITEWVVELSKTGKELVIENCGDNGPTSWSVPDPKDLVQCDFSLYRISTDIAPQFYSTMFNLQHTTAYQDLKAPMSRPGCWAYPDMLQVGNNLDTEESRTHFAAWCVTSAPLVLGFDLTNNSLYGAIYPIVTNKAAVEINQDWSGHPGYLAAYAPTNFTAPVAHGAGRTCDPPAKCEQYSFNDWQAWVKPVRGGTAMAVLFINLSPNPVANVTIPLSTLNITAANVTAADVWTGVNTTMVTDLAPPPLDPHHSYFAVLFPSP